MRRAKLLRTIWSAFAGLAALGAANGAAASAGCDTINAVWGGGVTLSGGAELYEPWPLPALAAGDVITYSASTSGSMNASTDMYSGGGFALYREDGGTILIEQYAWSGAELNVSATHESPDAHGGYIIHGWSGSSGGTLNVTVTCTPAVVTPVASSFTYGSIVAYNDGSDQVTSFNLSSQATNNPTSYTVASPTTAQGGSVSIDNSGQVSYVPPAGYRGANDSFVYRAINSAGTSNPGTVTVVVGNPTYYATLSSSTAMVGAAYNPGGAAVVIEGGTVPYSGFSATGLPAGLSISGSGVISGTPTTSGSFVLVITATDSSTGAGAFTGTANATLNVAAAPPTVTDVYPDHGSTAGGETVTLTGTNLTGVTAARFGSYSATIVGIDSATSMRVTAPPAAAAGAVNVTVTTSSGTSGSASANLYTYIAPPAAPVIVSAPPSVTNSTSATFSVTPAAGTTLVARLDAGAFVEATSPVTYTGLADGSHTVWFRSSSAGVTGAEVSYSWTVDTTAPASPVVTSPANGSSASDTTPTVSGSSVGGATVTVHIDGSAVGTTTANGGGDWSFDVPNVLSLGSHTVYATATDPAGNVSPNSSTNTFTIVPPTITVAPTSLAAAAVGAAYSQTITASGGAAGYTYQVTAGALPAGLTLASGGTLSGTPTAGGTFNFTVTATDSSTGSGPFTGSRAYTLTVATATIAVSPTTLSNAVAATAYSQTVTATGGTGPYSYAVTAGALPPGWTLSSAGVVSGVATSTGSFNFTLTATDSSTGAGAPYSGSRAYSVSVATPNFTLMPPTLSGILSQAYSGAFVAGGGTAPYAYSVAAGAVPPGLTLASDGTLSGTPTASGTYNFTVVARDSTGGPGAPYGVASNYNFTVANPAAPTVSNLNVSGAYDVATAIDLSTSIAGVHTSVAVTTAPAHGTTSVAGDVVTYTPTAGYYGADSFTYAATGPGGTSAAATVSLTVGAPAAPVATDVSGIAVPYESAGAAIDLSGAITGVHLTVAVATAPAHGSASVAGDVVTYTPAAGYYGADSFTYTATGPGGASARATVTLTVGDPAAPVATDVSGIAVPYESAGAAIDLSGAITGVHSSVAVATAPAHGTTSVAGDLVTYTPAAGYYGADSFTYTATGPGGTSAPATVTLMVGDPAAPVATDVNGISVPYESAGAAIDLSSAITGVHSSVAVATAPAHGTASVAGDVVTYTPAAGYYGADSFTYTATGPGGTSAPATVTLTVGAPPPPAVDEPDPVVVEPAEGDEPTVVDLSAISSGVVTGFRVEDAPSGGEVSIMPPAGGSTGWRLVYTPAPNFMGADVVTIVAQGPGGESAPTSFTFRVLGQAPDLEGVAVDGEAIVFKPTAGLTGGPFEGLIITRQPEFGVAEVEGLTILYRPVAASSSARLRSASVAAAVVGETSLEYAVVLPFGQSLPGMIAIEAVETTPDLTPLTAATLAGRPVTVSLTETATRGPFTGAAVLAVDDEAGSAIITEGGAVGARTYDLTFTPKGDFTGIAVVTYTLSNAGGATQGELLVTVDARPDPAQDPEVRGLMSAQIDSARRFTRAQTDNFHRRLEQVRRGGSAGASNGLTLNLGDNGLMDDPREALRSQLGQRSDGPSPFGGDEDPAALLGRWTSTAVSTGAAPSTSITPATAGQGAMGVWTSGSIDWGRRDAKGQRDYRFTTSGLSAGVDMAVSDSVVVGLGVGYGHDRSKVGDNGTLSDADSYVGAVYGSWRATEGVVMDGVLGYGALEYDSRRWSSDEDGFLLGQRSGSLLFGSASVALERSRGALSWAPYARFSFGSIALDGFTETGSEVFALNYQALDTDTLASALGASFDWSLLRRDGVLSPSLRFEWRHEFEGSDDQIVSYADWLSSPDYAVGLEQWGRDSVSLAVGLHWRSLSGWSYGADYQGQVGSGLASHGLRLRLLRAF